MKTPEYEIKRATVRDKRELVACFQTLSKAAVRARYQGEEHPDPFTLDEFIAFVRSNFHDIHLLRILEPHKQLAGWGEFYPYGENQASLSLLIHPSFQGRGLGFELAQHLIREARRKLDTCFITWGIDESQDPNSSSHRLIRKLGRAHLHLNRIPILDTQIIEYILQVSHFQNSLPLESLAA